MYLDKFKNQFNKSLENFNETQIKYFADNLSTYKNLQNNIFITGIGKSKHFAKHMSDILKSLSYKCFFLDGIDSIHGDIGSIREKDILIVISKSGNTNELKYPIEILKNKKIIIFGIFCNKNSILQSYCDNTIILPSINEMDPDFNMVPSNSIIIYHTFLSLLIRHIFDNDKITLNDYSKNHPAGDIGKKALTLVKHKTKTNILKININEDIYINSNIFEIMKKMDKLKTGICCFINNNNNLYGILTNGMIISELSKGNLIIIESFINKNPFTINDFNIRIEKLKLPMKHRYFPVINDDKLYGIYENLN